MLLSRARARLAFPTLLLVLVCAFLSSACLVRKRTVVPAGKPVNQPLLKATKEELIARVHGLSDPIQSFQMKVDMSSSVGMLYGGQVTDYPTISAYVLFRRPDDIRVIGLDPVLHGTAFDMLSMGNEFRVSIPSKNQFIEGRNDAPAKSANKLENLRPTAFLTSLLIAPPKPDQITVLMDDTDETKSVYILMYLRKDGDNYLVDRNLYFDRTNLSITRQKTFDGSGYITSQTRYSKWQNFSNILYPTGIDIQRPQDGYELVLDVTDLKFNSPEVTANKFVLPQPPDAQVKVLQ